MSGFDQARRASTGTPVSVFSAHSSKSELLDPQEAKTPATPIFRPIDLPEIDNSKEQARELQRKVSHLTRAMHHNLQSVLQRGSSLSELETKVGSLEMGSKSFQRTATKVDRNLWWEEHRYTMLACYAVLLIIACIAIYIFIRKLMPF